MIKRVPPLLFDHERQNQKKKQLGLIESDGGKGCSVEDSKPRFPSRKG